MSAILHQITIGTLRIAVVDQDPRQGSGLDLAIGSLAIVQGQEGVYQKTGGSATEWILSSVNRAQLEQQLAALDGRLDILEADPTTKSYVDSEVGAERSARELADQGLDSRLDSLEADPTTKSYVDSEIAAERNARELADSGLDSRLDALEADSVTKSYVDSQDASTLSSAQSYADQKVAALVNSAPEVLDTLKELADALGQDPNFATTVAGQIGSLDDKIDQEISDRISGDNALDARLDILEGADTVQGSVAKALKDAKDYADSKVSAEELARIAEDTALDARLDIIEGADTVEGSIAKAEKDAKDFAQSLVNAEQNSREQEDSALHDRIDALELSAGGDVSALQTALNQEIADRISEDAALQSQIDTEKARIDQILDLSQADKDSFKEIVDLINSVDTENDQAFAGYVLSNNQALADEIARAQAQEALKLNKAGDTMSGDLNMGGNDVVNVGALGLGTATPSTIFEVVESNVTFNVKGHSASTSDASPAALASYSPANNSVEIIKAFVTGIDPATMDSVSYERTVKVKNNNGSVSLGALQSDYTSEDASLSGAGCNVQLDGSSVKLYVTGLMSKTIEWACYLQRVKYASLGSGSGGGGSGGGSGSSGSFNVSIGGQQENGDYLISFSGPTYPNSGDVLQLQMEQSWSPGSWTSVGNSYTANGMDYMVGISLTNAFGIGANTSSTYRIVNVTQNSNSNSFTFSAGSGGEGGGGGGSGSNEPNYVFGSFGMELQPSTYSLSVMINGGSDGMGGGYTLRLVTEAVPGMVAPVLDNFGMGEQVFTAEAAMMGQVAVYLPNLEITYKLQVIETGFLSDGFALPAPTVTAVTYDNVSNILHWDTTAPSDSIYRVALYEDNGMGGYAEVFSPEALSNTSVGAKQVAIPYVPFEKRYYVAVVDNAGVAQTFSSNVRLNNDAYIISVPTLELAGVWITFNQNVMPNDFVTAYIGDTAIGSKFFSTSSSGGAVAFNLASAPASGTKVAFRLARDVAGFGEIISARVVTWP